MKRPFFSFAYIFLMINQINEKLMNYNEIKALHRTSPSLLESPCHSNIVLGRRFSSDYDTPKQCVELSEVCSTPKEESLPFDDIFNCDYGYLALPVDLHYSYP